MVNEIFVLSLSGNQQTNKMNWIYNSKPDTARDVLVAFKMEGTNEVHYNVAQMDYFMKGWLLPESWEVIAWADFPRLRKDNCGQTLMHNYLSIQGLES